MKPNVVIDAFLKFMLLLPQFSANTSITSSIYPLGNSIAAIKAMTEAADFITSTEGQIKTPRHASLMFFL